MRPKIVTPHLILLPKFSLDTQGKYAVSHGPMLLPAEHGEPELLRFFLAILNSAVVHWQLTSVSHRYSRGYLKLEKLTLESVRVPSPSRVSPGDMTDIVTLTDKLIADSSETSAQRDLDLIIARLYGLSARDLGEVGIATRG